MNITVKNIETNENKQYSIINNIIEDPILFSQIYESFYCDNPKNEIIFSNNNLLSQIQSVPKSFIESNYDFFNNIHEKIENIIFPIIKNESKIKLEKNIFNCNVKIKDIEENLSTKIQYIKENNNNEVQ
jgi:hypothetical protein